MKRIVAAVVIAGATLGLSLPALAAPTATGCLHVEVSVAGQNQVIDQCLPGN